jgi:hypothetical protein
MQHNRFPKTNDPGTGQEKVTHFLPSDYHLHTLRLCRKPAGTAAVARGTPALHLTYAVTTRRTIMAKGQQRKTKEAKKPKKQPVPAK